MTRNTRPRCPECRYDLGGLEVGGTCPECGWEIEFLRPLARARGDAIAAALISMTGIIADVLACGYPPLLIVGPVLCLLGTVLGVVAGFRSNRGPRDQDTVEAVRLAVWGGCAGMTVVPFFAIVVLGL